MKDLTTLANKYLTDKGTMDYGHGYSVIYHEIFKELTNKSIRLLEIGVCDPRFPGASLKMWEEYFPYGNIVGMDINPDAKSFITDRTQICIGDQNNTMDLESMIHFCGPEFDIIIDDGSHVGEHILTSFKSLWNAVKPGGYYIIEDLHSAYTNAPVTIAELNLYIQEQMLNLEKHHLYGGKLIIMKKAL